MTDYRDRVIQECADLEERRHKLRAFIQTPAFEAVDEEERARLLKQCAIMGAYADILFARIGAFKL